MLFVTRASITPTVRISDVNLELFKVFGKLDTFEARLKKLFRYYRKLREVASSPPLSAKQPDVTACSATPIGSPRSLTDDINHHPQSSRSSSQKTERNSLSSVKPFSARLLDLTRINSTVGSRKKSKNDRVDYVPINKGCFLIYEFSWIFCQFRRCVRSIGHFGIRITGLCCIWSKRNWESYLSKW